MRILEAKFTLWYNPRRPGLSGLCYEFWRLNSHSDVTPIDRVFLVFTVNSGGWFFLWCNPLRPGLSGLCCEFWRLNAHSDVTPLDRVYLVCFVNSEGWNHPLMWRLNQVSGTFSELWRPNSSCDMTAPPYLIALRQSRRMWFPSFRSPQSVDRSNLGRVCRIVFLAIFLASVGSTVQWSLPTPVVRETARETAVVNRTSAALCDQPNQLTGGFMCLQSWL